MFDIYLGGPWEQYAILPFKTKIKKAFPDKRMYDPETNPAQITGNWFQENYKALKKSRTMVAMSCPLPFSGVAQEAGIYYAMHSGRRIEPIENLIIIWPDIIKPQFGKEVAKRMGYVCTNLDEAIVQLRRILT